jgi:DNA-binding CsgD family transcriptional regulator
VTLQISNFVEASGRAANTDEVFCLLRRAASPLGFGMVALIGLTIEARELITPGSDISPFLASNYPKSYLHSYVQLRHYEIDPVLLLARESLTPLIWGDVMDRIMLSDEQKILEIQRRDAGLYGEVTCPVHGPHGQTFAVRFAHNHSGEHDRAHLSRLQTLAIHFYYAFSRVHQACVQSTNTTVGLADRHPVPLVPPRFLTQRERECLLWTARGKSASSISGILGLSENTINFYVKNAMRKFGTTNRVVAVVLAVRAGLIQP